MAQYRVLCSNGGIEEAVGGTWDGLKEAVRDPFTWYFCAMHFALVTAQAFKDFLPSVSGPNSKSKKVLDGPVLTHAPTDCQHVRPWRTDHLFHPSSSIRLCLRLCLRLRVVFRPATGVFLAYCWAHHRQCYRMLDADCYRHHRCSICRLVPADCGNIQRPQLAAVLGDDPGSCTTKQEGSPDRHRQLHQSV
jgi:hypothetical protein